MAAEAAEMAVAINAAVLAVKSQHLSHQSIGEMKEVGIIKK